VSSLNSRRTSFSKSLDRLRWRLTVWYAGTFLVILTLLGIGMFAAITWRFDSELDRSLDDATRELIRVATTRDSADASHSAALFDPRRDPRIPDRQLFIADTLGISPDTTLDQWLRRLAGEAGRAGSANATQTQGDRILRGHAQSFAISNNRTRVALAVADEIELEDRYAVLIAAFGVSAFVAVVLVSFGGWWLARKSIVPVDEAFSYMRRFMADAAHELRTPLTVVRARAEVALQRARDPGEYADALRGIERETTRLGRLVEDLLMLARADAGERRTERRRVFLDDVTLDAAEAARLIADRKSVRLAVADFEEAPVSADPDLLRQLVMILLDNAIKFTPPEGTVQVQVMSRGSFAELVVADSGVGIPRDQVDHVFERFYRGDPSRTRGAVSSADGSTGVGLGLSIAQWIAEEHDATIGIESEPGQGTRVTVRFSILPRDVVSSS
jgi:signal transduction histidine kinase